MNDNLEKIFQTSENVTLSSLEKENMRTDLLTHIKDSQKTFEQKNVYLWTGYFYKHAMSLALVCVFFFSGATSALAEKSNPGDILYAIKTKINEQVLGWFVTNPDSKTEWQISLAERRLDEVKYLSKNSEVSSEVKAKAKQNLDLQIERVESETQVVDESDSDAVAPVVSTMSVAQKQTEPTATLARVALKSMEVSSTSATTTLVKTDDRAKEIESKITALRKVITSKTGLKKSELNRLRGQLIVSEKALIDSEDGTGDKNDSLLKAEKNIEHVEIQLNDKKDE